MSLNAFRMVMPPAWGTAGLAGATGWVGPTAARMLGASPGAGYSGYVYPSQQQKDDDAEVLDTLLYRFDALVERAQPIRHVRNAWGVGEEDAAQVADYANELDNLYGVASAYHHTGLREQAYAVIERLRRVMFSTDVADRSPINFAANLRGAVATHRSKAGEMIGLASIQAAGDAGRQTWLDTEDKRRAEAEAAYTKEYCGNYMNALPGIGDGPFTYAAKCVTLPWYVKYAPVAAAAVIAWKIWRWFAR